EAVMPALALLVASIAGGTIATYGFDRRSPGYARLATGCVVGLTTFAFLGFVLASILGMGPAALGAAATLTLLPASLLREREVRVAIRSDIRQARLRLVSGIQSPSRATLWTLIYGATLGIGVWLIADRTFFETADGLYIGNVNNLGDLPYHAQISASFAYGQNFPPQNPFFAGSGFSYHYLADFLAASFVTSGLSLVQSMFLVTLVLLGSLLVLIHRWVRDITRNAVAARLSPLLVVCSGGLGWMMLIDQARVGERGVIAAFAGSDARYTIGSDSLFRFGNAITTLLIPQRGLLLAAGLAVIVLGLLWHQISEPVASREQRWRASPGLARMLVAGVLTGVLPIVHAYTFAVVLGTAFLLGLFFTQWREGRWRAWGIYVVATLAIALPILAWTAHGSQTSLSGFFGIQVGWDRGSSDPIWFWFANTGAFIPLLISGFAWRGRHRLPRKLLLYTMPFLVWFVAANIFRLAPWIWDNIKILWYWWLGSVPIVALVLARAWAGRPAYKVGAVALTVVLLAAGALDLARATIGPAYREFDRDAISFAEMIKTKTPPGAVILTAPVFDTPVYLTGRPVVMGYAGWLWSNGLPYTDRDRDLRAIYAGGQDAETLLQQTGATYIVLGPQERREVAPNGAFLAQFPVIASVGEYQLLEVAKP
ncbi:MAG: hypothetical protein ABI555_03405, partial [Chloroflexota bacterium]